jgi:hypothetical protein
MNCQEIKRRLDLGNVCYRSVQNFLSSPLLSKIVNVRKYKNIDLPVVLYECETLYLTSRKEQRPRVFQNRVLRRVFRQTRG